MIAICLKYSDKREATIVYCGRTRRFISEAADVVIQSFRLVGIFKCNCVPNALDNLLHLVFSNMENINIVFGVKSII